MRNIENSDNRKFYATSGGRNPNGLSNALNKAVNILNDIDIRFRVEEDKSLIYDSKTNKDICMYFDEESKDFLLNLLNNAK
jgi:hypothetical protein